MSTNFGSQVMSFGFGSLAVCGSAAINKISSNKRSFSQMSSNDMRYAAMAAGPSHTPNIDMNTYGSTSQLALTLTSGLDSKGEMIRSCGDPGKNKVDEEYESRSGSDNADGNGSGDDQDDNQPKRKKPYHRHTPQQIQEMEAFFKEYPHPDEKQRQLLSKKLHLAPRQIKFWFQNRRTQMKAHQERYENAALRDENEKLRRENLSIREAMRNATCCNCGGSILGDTSSEDQQLRLENEKLKDELERVRAITGKLCGRQFPQMASHSPMPNASLGVVGVSADVNNFDNIHSSVNPTSDFLHGLSDVPNTDGSLSGIDKALAARLAVTSMDELLRMAQMQHPLWIPNPRDGVKEALNHDEYFRQFTRGIGMKSVSYKTEANRHAGTVIMSSLNLVEILMDASRCAEMFPSIISRATTLDVLCRGVGGTKNGQLQLMYMELHVLSPLGPTREAYFLRFCQQHAAGVWAVVDVSIDRLIENLPPEMVKCRRRPSGCIIQDMPNNCSKVRWVEHAEYDEVGIHHLYRSLVSCGMAFGSQRWLSTLQRQCERLAIFMQVNGDLPDARGQCNLLKLSQQMTNDFCIGVSASNVNNWSTLSCNGDGDDDIRVTTRKSMENPGEPGGVVLCAATSLWLPVPHHKLFDFFRDHRLRSQWDVLSIGDPLQEVTRIMKGHDSGNSVILLRTNSAFILQESCTDASGSLVVYGPVDITAMHSVMNGGDTDYVCVLPSGFVILPDESRTLTETGSSSHCNSKGGSVLTVALQILLPNMTTPNPALEDVQVVHTLISCTVQKIKSALISEDA